MSWRQRLRRLLRPDGPLLEADGRPPASRAFGFDRGQPVDRHYIDVFLARHRKHIRGDVLEVAGREYTERHGGASARAFELYTAPTGQPEAVIGDLTRPATLPAERFDAFVCTQTFNFIFDVQAAVQGAAQLLRPGGHLLATVGGVSQISRYDMDRWGDFWRFSSAACERLFAPHFELLEVRSYGNLTAAVALLRGLAVEDLRSPALLEAADPDYPVIIGVAARKR